MRLVRTTHLYCGVFIAPALIFFAFTGFIQTFGLHETARGSSYKPPAILVELGQLHKKQTLVVAVRKVQAPASLEGGKTSAPGAPKASPTIKTEDTPSARRKNLWPMKIFFGLVSIGLIASTATGLYMSYQYIRNTRLITALLFAGIVVPILLTFF